MPPRATWKGNLKLSLVTIPVRLYSATSSAGRIVLHQLHKGCHQRIHHQLTCPIHGPVEQEDVEKGYEYEKGKYVVLDEVELDHLKLETTKTIDVVQFIYAHELDPLYIEAPHYLAPDGPVADQAFRVIREAMGQEGVMAIGQVVMKGREHLVAIKAQDKGMVMLTLRYANEISKATPFFADIQNGRVDKEQLELARMLVKSKIAPFDPSKFTDRYEHALIELIRAKIKGVAPVTVHEAEVRKVINFMDALKASVAQTKKSQPVKSLAPVRKFKRGKSA
ncbi:MAG: Ku protein [Nitrospirae bacterium]|nr:MAG: Ku protein [Nitrospirota bacterium]